MKENIPNSEENFEMPLEQAESLPIPGQLDKERARQLNEELKRFQKKHLS